MHHLSKSERKRANFLLSGWIAVPLVWLNRFAEVKIMLSWGKPWSWMSTLDTHNEEANPFFERCSKASYLLRMAALKGRNGSDSDEQTPRHRAVLTDTWLQVLRRNRSRCTRCRWRCRWTAPSPVKWRTGIRNSRHSLRDLASLGRKRDVWKAFRP